MHFIKGIVKLPVVTVLAVELPDTVPIIPLETTAALAGPPLVYPVKAVAKSIKNLPAPVLFNIAPNETPPAGAGGILNLWQC